MSTDHFGIKHSRACTGPDVALTIGEYGDPLHRCRSCRRFIRAARTKPEPTADPEAPATRTVCREHLTPVTARGKGCPQCITRRAEARAARVARRRVSRRQPTDTTTHYLT